VKILFIKEVRATIHTKPNRGTKSQTIADEFRAKITARQLQPGDRLPSFAEMKAQYGLAPQTTDRIYSGLEREGLIVRAQGSGVFVAEPGAKPQGPAETGQMAPHPLIGLLLPNVDQLFFAEILAGAEAECREAGAHLVVATTDGSPHLEAQHLASLAGRVSGLGIVPTEAPSYAAYYSLLEKRLPFVFIDFALPKINVSLASADNECAGYLATRHLIQLGHKRIHLLAHGDLSSVTERINGYRKAMREAGLPYDPALELHHQGGNEPAGYALTRRILEESGARTGKLALFCVNDPIARGAYIALKEAGLAIPRDAAVIAVADKGAVYMDPPLTAVEMDLRAMGRSAVRLVIESLKRGDAAPVRQIRHKPELVIRNSTDPHSDFCNIKNFKRRVVGNGVLSGLAV